MILPNVRTSFGRREVDVLLEILSQDERRRREHWEEVLSTQGLDALLDHPRTLEQMMRRRGVETLPVRLLLYVMIRRSLLEAGVESRVVADYVTAVVADFGYSDRAHRIEVEDEEEYRYLVDLLEDITEAEGRRRFLLQAHLGNFALWLSGLFPDYIVARVERRGGPGLDYYEEMGQAGFRMAAETPHAQRQSLDVLYRDAAALFGDLRCSLNRISDRYFFRRSSVPVERLIRQARDGFWGDQTLH